jgi:O-antigen ligase
MGVERTLAVGALALFVVVAPLLPTNDLKADATLFAAAVLAIAFYIRVRSGRGMGRTTVDLPALAFLVVAVLATIFSVDPLISFVPSRRMGEGLLVYVGYVAALLAAARLWRRERDVLVTMVLLSGAVVGAVGVAQFFGVDPLAWFGFHFVHQAAFSGLKPPPDAVGPFFGIASSSTLGNPIFLGGYAAALLPIALGRTMTARGWPAWPYGITTVMLVGGVAAAQSRAGWGAGVVGVVLLLALWPRRSGMWRRMALPAAAAVVLIIVMFYLQEAAFAHRVGMTVSDDSFLRVRLYLWKHTIPMIMQRPLLGWGFSTLLGRFADLGSAEYFSLFGVVPIGIDTPHNDLLHIAYTTGLLGLAAYLWIWLTFARSLARARAAGGAWAVEAAALIASLAGYFLWAQTAWLHVGPAHLFWILGALGVAVGRQPVSRPAATFEPVAGTPLAIGTMER